MGGSESAAPAGAAAPDRASVALIDGHAEHRGQVVRAMEAFYAVTEYGDSSKALAVLPRCPPALILVDEKVPPHGLAATRFLRSDRALARVPVVVMSHRALTEAELADMKADGQLVKPFRRSTLLSTISHLINRTVEKDWEKLPEVPREALQKTVEAFNGISDLIDKGEPLAYTDMATACAPLVSAVSSNDFRSILDGVKNHDNYSYVHSLRVATLLSLFGSRIGLPESELLLLASGGLMHDIGKMSIPHAVLNKPGKLDEGEWELMRSHVSNSSGYLRNHTDSPRGVLTIAEQHHEKLNGRGYPKGMRGTQLNELARMASIVDVFGALTDRRVYKAPMPPEKALSIMTGEMGEELDQGLLSLFREMLLDAAAATTV